MKINENKCDVVCVQSLAKKGAIDILKGKAKLARD